MLTTPTRGIRAAGVAIVVLLALAAAACERQTAPRRALSAGALAAHGVDLEHLVVGGREAVAEPAPPAPTIPSPPPEGDAVIQPPPATFDAPPAPPPPAPAALQRPAALDGVTPAAGTWAVVIGVNDYPGVRSDLRSAVNDANDVDLALAGLGVPQHNRLVLRDGQATADRIRAATDWLVAHAAPEAVAVFFYAGHVRKLGSTEEALVAADGQLVGDKELAARLGRLQAGRAWVAIAACYGGGFTEVLAPGRVLTAAASADSLAFESSQFGRSYMVQYMVREAMIDRRAPESVQTAFAYARAELSREHPERQPVQFDSGTGPLDLRPGSGAPTPRPAGPPAGSPGAGSTPPSTPPTTTCQQFLLFSSCSGSGSG